ncbi:glycosyltransferase [Novipirellula sp.]|uniref:glycosyltransferase n=1 Tax=Novipirellula sp. TaxID=2795430 RepID=UPI00356A89F5
MPSLNSNQRVLLISSNSSGRGGGERYLVHLAEALGQLKVDVHALLSDVEYMDDWESGLSEANAEVHRLPLKGLVHRKLRFVQSIYAKAQQKQISAKCVEIAPTAILVNQQYDEDGLDYIMGALDAKVCPVAGVIHMPMTQHKNDRPMGRVRGVILRRWYNRYPYKIVLSSVGGEAEFSNYYGSHLNTSIVVSGVPLEQKQIDRIDAMQRLQDPWITASMSAPRLPVVGTACQFVPQKNLDLLVDGWLQSTGSGIKSRLLLIGDGPERERIEQRLSGVDASLWHTTGWTDKYADYLAQLDVFLMTSHFEGLPLTLIEVAGMGIPCILVDFNGADEVARQAWWVKVVVDRDAKTLGAAIQETICSLGKQKASENELATFVAAFSPLRMAREYLDLFADKP